jgi:hypothetical protein
VKVVVLSKLKSEASEVVQRSCDEQLQIVLKTPLDWYVQARSSKTP